ncbi:MAG: hypothetical protein ACRBB0_10055 [Pelagimonas sp.]|uniref:hypothetical protein n=1 Tax=Pelagimonas sp. TaxID=2073170 RepID=UPI003D6C6206
MTKHISFVLFAALCALPVVAARAQVFSATDMEINAFVRADGNRDGVLTLPEFRVFVKAMAKAGQPTAMTIRTFGAYRFAFGIVDINKDGRASPEELRSADTDYRSQ